MKTLSEYSAEGKMKFEDTFLHHPSGIWRGGKITHPEFKPLTIANVQEWLESHDRALIEAFMKEVMPEEYEHRKPTQAETLFGKKLRRANNNVINGFNSCRDRILTRAQEFLGESKV